MSSRGRRIARVVVKHAMRAALRTRLGCMSGPLRRTRVAREARLACEELGPMFIKLGQLASVRPDVFSPEMVFELEALQDSVPPVPAEEIRAVLRRELAASPETLFSSFDDEPIAAASIAQVHRATLATEYRAVSGRWMSAGTVLAVKVVRPGARETIRADLVIARRWARRLDRLPLFRRIDLCAFLDEFEASLGRELDLRNEGRTAERFAHDFRDDPLVFTPDVVWPRSTRSVLTMSYVEGWRLTELGEAARRGVDARMLAIHGADVFMRQVLVLGRYHADLHPANLFVTPDGRIAYLDFGIIGSTEPEERLWIAQVLAATVYGDAVRAIEYSARLGLVVPPDLRSAVTTQVGALMASTIGGRERADLRAFVIGFLRIMAANRIHVPTGYGMLVKALVTVEGVAQAIYPDIDIVAAAKPFATRLIADVMLRPEHVADRLPSAIRAALREFSA